MRLVAREVAALPQSFERGSQEVEDGLMKLIHRAFVAMRTCAVGAAQHDVFMWRLQLPR
jgi:hypothetical protein